MDNLPPLPPGFPPPPPTPPEVPPPSFSDDNSPLFTKRNLAYLIGLLNVAAISIVAFGPIRVLGFLIVAGIVAINAYRFAVDAGKINRSLRLERAFNITARIVPFLSAFVVFMVLLLLAILGRL